MKGDEVRALSAVLILQVDRLFTGVWVFKLLINHIFANNEDTVCSLGLEILQFLYAKIGIHSFLLA